MPNEFKIFIIIGLIISMLMSFIEYRYYTEKIKKLESIIKTQKQIIQNLQKSIKIQQNYMSNLIKEHSKINKQIIEYKKELPDKKWRIDYETQIRLIRKFNNEIFDTH